MFEDMFSAFIQYTNVTASLKYTAPGTGRAMHSVARQKTVIHAQVMTPIFCLLCRNYYTVYFFKLYTPDTFLLAEITRQLRI